MTAEELLKPRYKLIANTCDSYVYILDPKHFKDGYLESHPDLFKKLNWWEYRKVEDMPKKLKSFEFSGNESFFEIKEWDMQEFVGYLDSTHKDACVLGIFKPEYDYYPVD